MTQFKKMVFKLDPDNREEEGERVERYLQALGYKDDDEWNKMTRDWESSIYVATGGNGLYGYHNHPCWGKEFEPIPTAYQVAVASHMEGAPEELAEYVRGRLRESKAIGILEEWREGVSPIQCCGFFWDDSEERGNFWDAIDDKLWEEAMDTDFWKSYTEQNPEPEERPKGVTAANPYDFINPDHYKQGSKEVIEMMVDIWGAEAVATHCEICAFKYRMRLGNKPDQPIERDLEKAKWYENKAKDLRG